MEQSRMAQRQADKLVIGKFLDWHRGVGNLRSAVVLTRRVVAPQVHRDGLSVRPTLVTLLGYLVIIDAAINTVGWALDLVANHPILAGVLLNGWGNMFDAGYFFWHYNELWVGVVLRVRAKRLAGRPDPDRIHDADRRRHRVLADEAVGAAVDASSTCWMGVVIWIGYVFNMTMFADVRFAGVVFPVIGGGRPHLLLHHPVPRYHAHRQPRDLLRLNTKGGYGKCSGKSCRYIAAWGGTALIIAILVLVVFQPRDVLSEATMAELSDAHATSTGTQLRVGRCRFE